MDNLIEISNRNGELERLIPISKIDSLFISGSELSGYGVSIDVGSKTFEIYCRTKNVADAKFDEIRCKINVYYAAKNS